MGRNLDSVVVIVFIAAGVCCADTFVHRHTGEELHGYATQESLGSKSLVYTEERGQEYLNLGEYDIRPDRFGRENKVIIISIEEDILLEIETQAIEKAIVSASNQGPLFILLEIDTPGGRVDLAKRICAVITGTDNCQVIAHITGGKYGGALSAGAAIALACDRIYISDEAAIGSAALMTADKSGPRDLEEILSETVHEKIMSAWRGYFATLAERKKRPGLLAMAMVDKDIEVIEVDEDGERIFIEPEEKRPAQEVVQAWSSKDSLVTLTARDAVKCNIADKVITSRRDLLLELNAVSAGLEKETGPQEARGKFEKAMARFEKLKADLDYHSKQLHEAKTKGRQLAVLRSIISDYENLIRVAKNFSDVPTSVKALTKELNSAKAVYEGARRQR